MTPTMVVVTVDCPACGFTRALMDTATRHGRTGFMCDSGTCLHLWVGDVVEPDTCGLGLRGPASCPLPPGHDEPCRPAS